MAQLQKQSRRAAARERDKDTRTHIVSIQNFNPVVRPGVEIVMASTLHNIETTTHIVVTSRRKS